MMKGSAGFAFKTALLASWSFAAMSTVAGAQAACAGLPTQAQLKAALVAAVSAETSGLNNHMWATIVNRDGVVCAVAFSGSDRSAELTISRVDFVHTVNSAIAVVLDHSAD